MSIQARLCILAALLVGSGFADAKVADPISTIAGRWRVVILKSGEVNPTCDNPEVFAPTADGQFVDLSYVYEGVARRERYIVLQAQPDRALMFIQGEKRLTDSGDPVIWWAVFTDSNHFRWRRYDWPRNGRTVTEWQRCPS